LKVTQAPTLTQPVDLPDLGAATLSVLAPVCDWQAPSASLINSDNGRLRVCCRSSRLDRVIVFERLLI